MNGTEDQVVKKTYLVTSELFEDLEANEVSVAGDSVTLSDGRSLAIRSGERPGVLIIRDGEREFPVTAAYDSRGVVRISYNGYVYELCVSSEKENFYKKLLKSTSEVRPSAAKIVSPMPGLIKGISVGNGQLVKKGENLFILEAMKMENIIKAPISGIVHNLTIKEGNTVEKSTVLCVLDPQ